MILAIDPSINNTGWAIYRSGGLFLSGVVKTQGETVVEKLQSLYHQVRNEALCHDIKKAIIEIPGSFSYARSTGRYGKALNQSAIGKLNMAIGVIMLACAEWKVEVDTVEAHVWKTRRSKKLDTSIARSLTGKKVLADEADAILLGMWYQQRVSR